MDALILIFGGALLLFGLWRMARYRRIAARDVALRRSFAGIWPLPYRWPWIRRRLVEEHARKRAFVGGAIIALVGAAYLLGFIVWMGPDS